MAEFTLDIFDVKGLVCTFMAEIQRRCIYEN